MYRYYTGIGSRKTPKDILMLMTSLASILRNDFILRSGGALGADTAFAEGAIEQSDIYVPWNNFNGIRMLHSIPKKAYEIASHIHPAWHGLSAAVRSLMARNVMQVFGHELNVKSEFIVCWTPDGAEHKKDVSILTGGTGLAISLASVNNIPVYNLKNNTSAEYIITKYLINKGAV